MHSETTVWINSATPRSNAGDRGYLPRSTSQSHFVVSVPVGPLSRCGSCTRRRLFPYQLNPFMSVNASAPVSGSMNHKRPTWIGGVEGGTHDRKSLKCCSDIRA